MLFSVGSDSYFCLITYIFLTWVVNRLETFLTLLALSHFVTNHIFLYSSVNTCRIESPHVWWLAFGIVSIGYLVVLEIFLIAFVVFVLGPLLLVSNMDYIYLLNPWADPVISACSQPFDALSWSTTRFQRESPNPRRNTQVGPKTCEYDSSGGLHS